jgi:hypothetical protein
LEGEIENLTLLGLVGFIDPLRGDGGAEHGLTSRKEACLHLSRTDDRWVQRFTSS